MRIVKDWKPFNIFLKSYILDGTKFLSLSLGYVTMLQCYTFFYGFRDKTTTAHAKMLFILKSFDSSQKNTLHKA